MDRKQRVEHEKSPYLFPRLSQKHTLVIVCPVLVTLSSLTTSTAELRSVFICDNATLEAFASLRFCLKSVQQF